MQTFLTLLGADEVRHVEKKKPGKEQLRPWRLTKYYVASQSSHPGNAVIPILRSDGVELGKATAGFFSSLSLEGTGLLANGKLVNVSGVYIPVDADVYEPVWTYHKKYLKTRPPGYSGLIVKDDRVQKAFAFKEIPASEMGVGYGKDNGLPRDPFRSLAADLGRTAKSDTRYKGKGGLVPVGTQVYILELDGMKLPDGSTHDGWLVVNDTGGGIFGAHFDLFVGPEENDKVKTPHTVNVWFDGIEKKVPEGYDYGLVDKK